MSTLLLSNGAPAHYPLGINDKSIRNQILVDLPQPIHLPLQFGWASFGPSTYEYVLPSEFPVLYGSETLNPDGKYTNHASAYTNFFIRNANPIVFKRLIPPDAGPKASLRISMEVLETELDEIEREIDGNFKYDTNGDPVLTGNKINGYKIKFHQGPCERIGTSLESDFSKGAIKPGTMTDPTTGATSLIIPLFDMEAPYIGSECNNLGVKFWAPTVKDSIPMVGELIKYDKVYPYRLSVMKREGPNKTGTVSPNLYGMPYGDFSFKKGLIDSQVGKPRYIQDVLVDDFKNLDRTAYKADRWSPVELLHVYQENIVRVLKMFYEVEKEFDYENNILFGTGTDPELEEYHLFNFMGLQQPSGIPYQGVRFDSANATVFSEKSSYWMSGGSDGTMNDEVFAELVANEINRMNNENDEITDITKYPFNFFWDSGYPLEVKRIMGKMIALRKSMIIVTSSYVKGERILNIPESSARNRSVVDKHRTYIESEHFATPTVRAINVMESGLLDKRFGRVPCSFELARMISDMCKGPAFEQSKRFDRPPNNTFKVLSEISNTWKPLQVRKLDYGNGGMYPENLTEKQVYFAATRTIYENETSILTSIMNTIVAAQCEIICEKAHKYHSGFTGSRGSLQETVLNYANNLIRGRFGDEYTIIPEVVFTSLDMNKGYAWTLYIHMSGPMMYTVQSSAVHVYNIDGV